MWMGGGGNGESGVCANLTPPGGWKIGAVGGDLLLGRVLVVIIRVMLSECPCGACED